MTNRRAYKVLAISSVIGLLVCMAGFGVLGIMWTAYPKDTGLPGWDSYYAATVGDGFFLPLLTASSVALALIAGAPSGRACIAGIAAAALGAATGIYVQLSWLADDNIGLNWTIPEPHHFNAAGVYHAVFFSAMCGAVGLFVVWYIASKWRSRNSPYRPSEGAATLSFWLASAGFLMMHALDDWTGGFGGAVQAVSAMALACMAGSLVLSAVVNAGKGPLAALLSQDLLMAWAGVALAFSFSVALTGAIASQEDAFFCVGTGLLCAFFAVIGFRYTKWLPIDVVAFFALGLAGAMAADVQDGLGPYSLSCAVALLVLFGAFAIRNGLVSRARPSTRRFYTCWPGAPLAGSVRVFISGMLPVVASAALFWIECRQDAAAVASMAASDAVSYLLYVLVLGLTAANGFEVFKSVIESERSDLRDERRTVSATQICSYIVLPLIAAGAFLVLLIVLMRLFASADALAFDMAGQGLDALSGVRIVLLVLDAACMAVLVGGALSRRLPFVPGLALLAVCYLLTAAYVGGLRLPVLVHPLQSLLLFPLAGSVLYLVEAIVSDCSLIRGAMPGKRLAALAVVVGVGCSAVFVLAVLPSAGSGGVLPPTLFFPAVGLIGLLAAFFLLPLAGALLIRDTWSFPSVQVTANTPLLSIVQAGSMGWVIAVFSGLVPSYYLAIANFDAIGMLGFIAILFTVSLVVFRPLENNAGNLDDCRERAREAVASAPDAAMAEDEASFQLRELKWHLERQAFAILLATFPGSFVALAGMWMGDGWGGAGRAASDDFRWQAFKDRMDSKYLLSLPWPGEAFDLSRYNNAVASDQAFSSQQSGTSSDEGE